MAGPLINTDEAAAMMGISKRAMCDLAAPRGPIPCYRLGVRMTRFKPEDIEAYIQACKVEKFDPVKEAGAAKIHTRTIKLPDSSELEKFFKSHGIDTAKVRERAAIKEAKRNAAKSAGSSVGAASDGTQKATKNG